MPTNPHRFRKTGARAYAVTVAATGADLGTVDRISPDHVKLHPQWRAVDPAGERIGGNWPTRDHAAHVLADAATEREANQPAESDALVTAVAERHGIDVPTVEEARAAVRITTRDELVARRIAAGDSPERAAMIADARDRLQAELTAAAPGIAAVLAADEPAAPLTLDPDAVADRMAAHGHRVIVKPVGAPPVAVRVTVQPDAGRIGSVDDVARLVAARLMQDGYDVARSGATVTATRPEPDEPADDEPVDEWDAIEADADANAHATIAAAAELATYRSTGGGAYELADVAPVTAAAEERDPTDEDQHREKLRRVLASARAADVAHMAADAARTGELAAMVEHAETIAAAPSVVTVDLSCTYACDREWTARVELPAPPEGAAGSAVDEFTGEPWQLTQWWDDVVRPQMGDGHRCGPRTCESYDEATVVEAPGRPELADLSRTWEG